jgi:LPXTG-motif cell wall-anchored protein
VYSLHYITVTGLSENQHYVFSIISGTNTYLLDSNPYEITTAKKLSQEPSSQLPLAGTIVTSSGDPAKSSILYVTTTGSEVLSTLTKDDGSYVIPLNAIRKADLSEYIPLSDASILKILAFNVTEQSHITVLANQTNPVPQSTLSKDYDFSLNQLQPTTPVASGSAAETSDFPSFSTKEVTAGTPTILTPEKQEGFTDAQPTFSGTGTANQTVSIEIHSTTAIKDTIKADAQGNWKYRPKQPLSPGTHTLTIVTKDAKGILKTITQSFVVYAEGSQSTQPSVSPVQPTAMPTVIPTKAQVPSPTATPKPIISSTPIPTVIPTLIIATPTLTVPTSTPIPTVIRTVTPLPATGSSSGVLLIIFGVVLVGVGMILFVLTQKTI